MHDGPCSSGQVFPDNRIFFPLFEMKAFPPLSRSVSLPVSQRPRREAGSVTWCPSHRLASPPQTSWLSAQQFISINVKAPATLLPLSGPVSSRGSTSDPPPPSPHPGLASPLVSWERASMHHNSFSFKMRLQLPERQNQPQWKPSSHLLWTAVMMLISLYSNAWLCLIPDLSVSLQCCWHETQRGAERHSSANGSPHSQARLYAD